MLKPLTKFDLDRLEKHIDQLNALVGLQSDTIKDVRWKIYEGKIKIKENEEKESKK